MVIVKKRSERHLLTATFLVLVGVGVVLTIWNSVGEGAAFVDLWLTSDQQGRLLYQRGEWAEAAQRFRSPLWRGVSLYRGGQFAEAAAVFAGLDTAESSFNRGNSLVMLGKYEDAISSYNRALELQPAWAEAEANRHIAQARLEQLKPPEDDDGGTGGMLEADEIVFDDAAGKRSKDEQAVEAAAGAQMSDSELRALWLRRVQTRPADFLKAKFAYQYSREQ